MNFKRGCSAVVAPLNARVPKVTAAAALLRLKALSLHSVDTGKPAWSALDALKPWFRVKIKLFLPLK